MSKWKHPCRIIGIEAQPLPHETEGLPQFRDGSGLKEGEMDGVAEIRKVLCYEWQKMSSYLVNIQNLNKNSFSILMS
jgi:hypothetical protein